MHACYDRRKARTMLAIVSNSSPAIQVGEGVARLHARKVFSVDRKRVQEWWKQKDDLMATGQKTQWRWKKTNVPTYMEAYTGGYVKVLTTLIYM